MTSKLKSSGKTVPGKTSANRPAPSTTGPNHAESQARLFKDQSAWSAWLDKNHAHSSGIWLRLAKKTSGLKSVTYSEALETALCYGWIDGQKRPESEQAWRQRFCPRSARSIWSRINREKALALIKSGRMKPAGHAAVEQARSNGRWESAYESPRGASVPDDFQAALKASPKANKFFEALDRANRYAILFRIQAGKKPETRVRNIKKFIAMLEQGKKIHS